MDYSLLHDRRVGREPGGHKHAGQKDGLPE